MHLPSSDLLSTARAFPSPAPVHVFLRLPQVLARVGISRSTLWRWVAEGSFPRPLKLSARVTVWRSQDIDAWMQARGNQENAPLRM